MDALPAGHLPVLKLLLKPLTPLPKVPQDCDQAAKQNLSFVLVLYLCWFQSVNNGHCVGAAMACRGHFHSIGCQFVNQKRFPRMVRF